MLLLGGPGAGKGTQARFLARILGVPHVASGEILREHGRHGTPLGNAARAYMDRGDLVPDRLVIDMIVERLDRSDAERGALLDGFPRTLAQAEALDRRLSERSEAVRAAVYLEVSKDVLIARLAGRWLCSSCQAVYHEGTTPAAADGVCSACGDRLYQRPDDRRSVVEKRVEVYFRETLPMIEHYAARGLLRRIDGERSVEEVRAALAASLGGVVRGRRRARWHVFVAHPDAGEGPGLWPDRTLCGKYVAGPTERETGSLDDFRTDPCRRCRHALRVRQGASSQPSPTGAPATSGGSCRAALPSPNLPPPHRARADRAER